MKNPPSLDREPNTHSSIMYNRNSTQAPACLQNNVGKPQVNQHTSNFSNRSNFMTLSTTGAESDDDEVPPPAVTFQHLCTTPAHSVMEHQEIERKLVYPDSICKQ